MTEIPRSTRAGRGQLAGPQATGSLVGSARTARQTRSVPVTIEEVRPGVMQLSTPFGWRSGLAHNAPELARIVASAFTEAQIHNHSMWRGRDETGRTLYQRPRPQRRGNRVDVHDPRAWRTDGQGRFVSPNGRPFRPDTQTAQRVSSRLMELGLSGTPAPLAENGS